MSSNRRNSLDPVAIEGWSWQPFLEDAVTSLKPLGIEPYPVEDAFLFKRNQTGSRLLHRFELIAWRMLGTEIRSGIGQTTLCRNDW